MCWDDHSDDQITMPELHNAIEGAGHKIDILGFDACNMGMTDVVYELGQTDLVDYVVGSEETIDQDGWPYDGAIDPIAQDPDLAPGDYAAKMIDAWTRYYRPLRCFTWVSLSAIDVAKFETAIPSIQAWIDALENGLAANRQAYRNDLDHTIYGWECWHVDMAQLGENLAADPTITDADLKTKSAAMAAAVRNSVVKISSGSYADDFSGLTIWWGEGGDWPRYGSAYRTQVAFGKELGWYAFLRKWNAGPVPPWPKSAAPAPAADRPFSKAAGHRGTATRAYPDPHIDRATYGLTDVAFADAGHGWAVGYDNVTNNAIILRTTDGGAHWTCKSPSAWWAYQFGAAAVRGATKAWAVGSEGWPDSLIVGTGNGGGSWTDQASHTKQYLLTVDFVGDTEGWAGGTGPILLHTTDGGAHWAKVPLWDGATDVWGVDFVDSLNGTIVGGHYPGEQGYIRQTSDGGQTWAVKHTVYGSVVGSVKMASATTGYAICGDPVDGRPVFFRTTDGGASWPAVLSLPFPGPWLTDVEAFNAGSPVWVVGESGDVRVSTDGGDAWQVRDIGAGADLTAVDFVDAADGWIVGDCEEMFHTTDGGLNWTSVVADVTGPTCRAWPASCRSGRKVTLKYRVDDDMSVQADVTLKVTTRGGRVLRKMHIGWKPTGVQTGAVFRCRLKPGAYRFTIYAKDEATNPQLRIGKAKLTVR